MKLLLLFLHPTKVRSAITNGVSGEVSRGMVRQETHPGHRPLAWAKVWSATNGGTFASFTTPQENR